MRLLVALCFIVSCSSKSALQPGTSLGRFAVTGDKRTATCGDGASAPNPWKFDVRFSREGPTLYWVQYRAPVAGRIDADRKTKLETTQTITVRQPDAGAAACVVTRTDTLEATLGPDEPLGDAGTGGFSTLDGTLTYTLTAEPGSDCSEIDPSVSVLPCSTVYDIHARRVGP